MLLGMQQVRFVEKSVFGTFLKWTMLLVVGLGVLLNEMASLEMSLFASLAGRQTESEAALAQLKSHPFWI